MKKTTKFYLTNKHSLYLSIFFIALFFFIYNKNIYSEVSYTASTLDKNTFSIGFHPQIYTKSNDIRGALQIAYGLVDNIDTKFRIGMALDNLFAGIYLSYQLINSRFINFSANFGYHYDSNIYFDYFFNLSSSFKYFDIYNGLKFKYKLTNNNDLASSYFLGFTINLNNDNKIILESGFNILNDYDWISIGISSLIK